MSTNNPKGKSECSLSCYKGIIPKRSWKEIMNLPAGLGSHCCSRTSTTRLGCCYLSRTGSASWQPQQQILLVWGQRGQPPPAAEVSKKRKSSSMFAGALTVTKMPLHAKNLGKTTFHIATLCVYLFWAK